MGKFNGRGSLANRGPTCTTGESCQHRSSILVGKLLNAKSKENV